MNDETTPAPRVWRFDRKVSSQNKTTYSHWSVHHYDKQAWMRMVRAGMTALIGERLSWSKWKIVRIYTGRCREYDYANFVGGCKPLVDCLTQAGIIEDDSSKHFQCEYEQTRGDTNETQLWLLEFER